MPTVFNHDANPAPTAPPDTAAEARGNALSIGCDAGATPIPEASAEALPGVVSGKEPRLTDCEADPAPEVSPRAARDETRADTEREPLAGDAESAVAEPLAPDEPVVSASAAGIAASAEPTPSATARAPTRPTYRE